MVLTMLTDGDAVAEAMTGSEGALTWLQPGSSLLAGHQIVRWSGGR
jgi:3-hydroxyisobutyrate dehydrogenase-like beta-hydroxyacid dehydrogenase